MRDTARFNFQLILQLLNDDGAHLMITVSSLTLVAMPD